MFSRGYKAGSRYYWAVSPDPGQPLAPTTASTESFLHEGELTMSGEVENSGPSLPNPDGDNPNLLAGLDLNFDDFVMDSAGVPMDLEWDEFVVDPDGTVADSPPAEPAENIPIISAFVYPPGLDSVRQSSKDVLSLPRCEEPLLYVESGPNGDHLCSYPRSVPVHSRSTNHTDIGDSQNFGLDLVAPIATG